MKNKSLMNAPIEAHTCILNGAKYTQVRLYPVEAHPVRLYTLQAHGPICGVIGIIDYLFYFASNFIIFLNMETVQRVLLL